MKADTFLEMIVDPGLHVLAEAGPLPTPTIHDKRARLLLVAIAGQESGWEARRQTGGPARGFWQFERAGIQAVMNHPEAARSVSSLCALLSIPHTYDDVYEAIAWNDHLATGLARLLLYTDSNPLPDIGNEKEGWLYYYFNWRPGKPREDDWSANYAAAQEATAEPTA